MVDVTIDVTDLGGEAYPGDRVVLWKPLVAGSASSAGRIISTAPVTVTLDGGKATVTGVEPGPMQVLLRCRGLESQGPVMVTVPDGTGKVTLRSLFESQFEYQPPVVSAVQAAADKAADAERGSISAQVRSEAAADRADAKVDGAINNGANLVRGEVKQDADRAVSARQAAVQSESNAKASEDAAATSESNAAASESAAKQSETNAGDYAAVATTATTEAVNAMEVASEAASSIGDSVSRAAASADSASQSETNAAQYESSAATHAQNATEAADRVGTAAQIEQWAQQAKDASDKIGIIPGVVDDDTTDNTAAIQEAVDQGGRWILPSTTGRYYVAGEVSLAVPGTEVYAQGAPIRQGRQSLFRAIAPDLRIDGVDSIGTDGPPDFSGMTASWEGTISASRWCAVNIYASAHRVHIPWIRGRGMSSVVRAGGWDATTNAPTAARTDDINIGTLLCSHVEFGTALKGTNRLHIGDIRGTYGDTVTSPRPPHLLYLAENHVDVTVLSAVAQNGVGGHAHQIKQVNGGAFGPLQATRCAGVLNLMDCADVEIESIISRSDQYSEAQGGAVLIDRITSTSNIHIGRARINMETNNRAVNILNGDRVTIDAVDVTVVHTSTGAAAEYDVTVGGTRCEVRNISVINTGPKAWKAVGVWGNEAGNRIHARELRGVRVGLDARTSPDVVFEYDADRIGLHPTDGLYPLAATAIGQPRFQAPQTQVLRDRAMAADDFTVRIGSYSGITSALTGQAWIGTPGQWRSSDSGAHIATDAVRARTFVDTGAVNVTVSSDIAFDGACGLIVKATNSDQSDYLYVMLTSTEVSLLVNGTETVATVPRVHQTGRTYHVEASYFAGTVDVTIDGVPVLSHTLTESQAGIYSPATYAGMCTSSAQTRFRNFKAVSI